MTLRERRGLGKQLGFCYDCLEPAVPGYTRCPEHLAYEREKKQRLRDAKAMELGWVLRRVPVGGP